MMDVPRETAISTKIIIAQSNYRTMGTSIKQKVSKAYQHTIFFITDSIGKGEIKIKFCLTKMLIANYFTKPLQEIVFHIFHSLILNVDDSEAKNYAEADQRTSRGSERHIK